jgi:putative colanic acid biosynthesis UDP-glucose lipid carrier transferase
MHSSRKNSSGRWRQPAIGDDGLQLRLLDLLFLAGTLVLLAQFFGPVVPENYLLALCLGMLLFQLASQIAGVYRHWRMTPLWVEISRVCVAWGAMLALLLLLAFSLKVSNWYSRRLFGVWGLVAPTLMVGWRTLVRVRAQRDSLRGVNLRQLAFVGAGSIALRMAAHLQAAPWMGVNIVGVYDDRQPSRIELGDLVLMGGTDQLLGDARLGQLDDIYITLPMHAQKRIIELVDALADTTVSVYVVPDSFIFEMMQANWTEVAGYPIIGVYETPFYGIDGSFKRLEDIVLGSLILLLICPLLLLLAIAVKLDSPGPVLFKQRRYGLNGQIVEVWKFRSMRVTEDDDVVVQASRDDARVTRLGQFMRRTSLDELPQFINVLQGHMSIVGPRPHAVAHNEQYRHLIHGYMLRHKVKPGITGWAQINGWRGETDTLEKMEKRVEFDLHYVRNWSFGLDLRIILLTVLKGFVGKNAF